MIPAVSSSKSPGRPRNRNRPLRRRLRRALLLSALAAVVVIPLSFLCDGSVEHFFRGLPRSVHDLAGTVSRWGDWPPLLLYALVPLGFALATRRTRLRRIVVCMMLSLAVSGLASAPVRLTTGRTRPYVTEAPQGFHGPYYRGHWTIGKARFNSFPSGHTAASVGLFGVLLFAGWRARILGLLLLPIIPLARLACFAHHFSDVATGAFFGLFGAAFVTFVLYPRLRAALHKVRFGGG